MNNKCNTCNDCQKRQEQSKCSKCQTCSEKPKCGECGCQTSKPAATNQKHRCNKNCYIAIANIPMQEWNDTYAVEKALQQGTIFPELDLPFFGKGVK